MKYDIFVSYSRRDKAKVDAIMEILINKGYSVWIDVDGIESGEAFRQNIVEAIENSSIIIFFSSESSNISKWTTKEISLAVEFSKYIIPIKFDNARYNKSILFDLIDLDYIDMSENRLMEASTQKLLRTIKSKIGEKDIPKDVYDKGYSQRSDEESIVNMSRREPTQFDIKNIKKSIVNCWNSRSNIINATLSVLMLLALIGLGTITIGFGFVFWPASIVGLYGIFLLLSNKEDGIAYIAGACLLWTLGEAYEMAPRSPVFRFFQDGNILIVWSPVVTMLTTTLVFFVRKNGVAWWRRCKKISMVGVMLLTITGIFWIWSIYFDIVTKFGLPPNIRYYIHKIFS